MRLSPFVPHPFLKSGSLQTFAGQVMASCSLSVKTEDLHVHLGDGDQLLLHINNPQSSDASKPVVVLFHGLGGDSHSSYILRITEKLNQQGYPVIRFNHRGCGPQATRLARQIYHAGRIQDIETTLAALTAAYPGRALLVAAFSLSANMLLRLLGEQAPRLAGIPVRAALAVCPPIDLELCSMAISSRNNRVIDLYFTRRLKRHAHELHKRYPDTRATVFPRRLNLRRFDELYTAPHAGFNSRDDYYQTASAKTHLANITLPTTILAAADDPIIPAASFDHIKTSKAVQLQIERCGGHMGFIAARPTPLGDRRWLDYAVVSWIHQHS